ncbi:MAG TPA: von Willebrand factor type A domain-containing protein [Thermoanaerobaculia bacterium]|nr:von Willebrand factor type A domain-containing protein [Thermoanaerobaculia bacterium]
MKRLLSLVIAFAACTTMPPTNVSTHGGSGSIHGQVTDSSTAPLPGVTVSMKDPRGAISTTLTDVDGKYTFSRLAAGRYTVTAQLSGLTPETRNVRVVADRVTIVELYLELGSVSETLTVTAEAPILSQRSAVSYRFASASPVPEAAPVPPPRPQYAAFEDHAFADTAKGHVTTFAIDVDRASYANIRRFLIQGTLPPRDAVRIEEMVNYFTYDYPQPSAEHPFSITTEVVECPWKTGHRLLRVGLQGRNLDQWKMAPNNLVFLIDVSGSMSGPNRLPLVQQAFRVLVEQLRAEDRVAIVTYAGSTGVVLPPTSGADKAAILSAIDRLGAGGSTAGAAGIELAYNAARESFIKGGNNRVILATDGDFNVGTTDIPALQMLIEQKRETGIFLSTIGVGDDNYQDAVMETLADKGNGNYAYLDSLQEAKKVFRTELTGTLVTIAKDVKVQLAFDPAKVASFRQIGYENRALANEDFDDDTKDAGELGAGHSVTALYEIVPNGNARGEIAKISLRYKQPDGETSQLVTAIAVDDGRSAYEASADMQFAAAVAQLGMLLRDSPHKGDATWEDVARLVSLSRGADLDGMRGELATLVDSARLMKAPDRVAIAK